MNNYINPNLPTGEVEGAWQKTVKNLSNLTTENKNKFEIIIVGCGLSGSSAAATLAEEGFKINLSLIMIVPEEHTQYQPKEVLMRQDHYQMKKIKLL